MIGEIFVNFSHNYNLGQQIDLNYRDLLYTAGTLGHGVFAMTMLGNNFREKWKLEKWLRYHPDLYHKWGVGQLFITLYKLNSKGHKYLKITNNRSTSLNYFSIQDIALINAYSWENGFFQKWRNIPHPIIETPVGKIGIISPKWGVSKYVQEVELLISLKSTKQDVLNRIASGELKINNEESLFKIQNASCPQAFTSGRII